MLQVVIIGGGLVGASVGYHLLRHGAQVTIIDRSDTGQATAAGAGILPPLDHFAGARSVSALVKAARAYYPELLAALSEDDESEAGYEVVGSLQVATDERQAQQLDAVAHACEARRDAGFSHVGMVTVVDGRQARALFPPLGRQVVGAVHASGAARIDARSLLGALRAAILKRAGRWLHGSAELALVGDRVMGVRVEGTALAADAVVVAGGAWSGPLGEVLGLPLCVTPQRGQLIHLGMAGHDTGAWPIVLGFEWNYLLGFPAGRIVAGATRDDVGYDGRTTAAGVHAVLDHALRVAPGLSEATLAEIRVGFRPVSSDGKPLLGVAPFHSNVFFATGHGGSGLELGPYSGAVVGDLVLGRAVHLDLSSFAPSRFTLPLGSSV